MNRPSALEDKRRPLPDPPAVRRWGGCLAVALLVALLVATAPGSAASEEPFDAMAQADVAFAQQQLSNAAAAIPTNLYPQYTASTGAWNTTSATAWTTGFFPGSLWLMYQQTFDSSWKTKAEAWLPALESQKNNTSTHDVGFMIFNSFGNGYRLTGNDAYRQVVLTAAASLATRYNAAVGCVRSWDSSPDFKVIVDNMMNLELLFWASKHGGNPAWYDMAVSHALRTMQDHVRPNGSTYHVVNYDPVTGAVRSKQTAQGAGTETTWGRGQAWAVYGFTMTYRETGDARFLDTARRLADYYLANVPADKIPYWDFQAPNIPNEPRDSSAAAIAASGLLELSQLDPDPTRSATYLNAATATLSSLSSGSYLARGTTNAAVLLHGTYNKPNNNYDTGLVWGDYYFQEALLRYRLIQASRLSLPVAAVTASSDDGNPAANAIDGSLATRWSASGDNQWISLDLGAPQSVEKVAIAFYLGDQRSSRFELQTSTDNATWSTALRSLSSGRTARQETFDFPDRTARYVRIVGFGNVVDALNGITEVNIFGGAPPPPDTTPPAPPSGLSATAGNGSTTLDWADNGEPDLAGYRVYRQNADGTWPPSPIASPTASAFTDTGLANGTTYVYRVTARDTAGNESAPSGTASATPMRPPLTKNHQPSGYTVVTGSVYASTGALSRLYANDGSRVEIVAARVAGGYTAEITVSATIGAAELATLRSLTVVEDGRANAASAALTLGLYNWRTSSWTVLDGPRTAVTSDRTFTGSPPGAASDYVSPSGEIMLSVKGTRSASFRTATDWVRFTIVY